MKKRLLLPILCGVTLGFLSSLSPVQARQLGGLRLKEFCQHKLDLNSRAVLQATPIWTRADASDWWCEDGNTLIRMKEDSIAGDISMDAACRWEYGRDNVFAQPDSWSDPYSWKCYEY